MTGDKEAFLDRWSRLKRERPAEQAAVPAASAPAPADGEAPPPLPPVEELKAESDFTPFMNARVDPATRRSALKKLFSDAHYNLADPFEAYSEDYTKSEPIPEKMLKAINRVRDVAVKGEEKVAEEERLAQEELAALDRAEAQAAIPPQAVPAATPPQAVPAAIPPQAVPTRQEPDDVAGPQDA